MRRSVVAVLALGAAAAASVAHAADLPAKPGYYPPVSYLPAVYNWSGIYFGGNVGGGFLNDQFQQTTTTLLAANGNQTNVKGWGALGGGQAGFNYQFSSWVAGAEIAITATGLNQSVNVSTIEPGAALRTTSHPNWLVDATARFGYAADTLLIYAKGGCAWAHATYTEAVLNFTGMNAGVTASTANQSVSRNGFVVGAGLEYGMTEELSARFEWNFYDFGSATYTFNVTTPAPAAVTMPTSVQSRINTFTVGLNYRFNWAPATASVVSARY